MKHDLTTGTWQDDTGCPISIILAATSDVWEVFKVLSVILVSEDVWEKAIERPGRAVYHDILEDIQVAAFRWNPVRQEVLNFVQGTEAIGVDVHWA